MDIALYAKVAARFLRTSHPEQAGGGVFLEMFPDRGPKTHTGEYFPLIRIDCHPGATESYCLDEVRKHEIIINTAARRVLGPDAEAWRLMMEALPSLSLDRNAIENGVQPSQSAPAAHDAKSSVGLSTVEANRIADALRAYIKAGMCAPEERTDDVDNIAHGFGDDSPFASEALEEDGTANLVTRLAQHQGRGLEMTKQEFNTAMAALWYELKVRQGMDDSDDLPELAADDSVARLFTKQARQAGWDVESPAAEFFENVSWPESGRARARAESRSPRP
jgi:hypothetical protein